MQWTRWNCPVTGGQKYGWADETTIVFLLVIPVDELHFRQLGKVGAAAQSSKANNTGRNGGCSHAFDDSLAVRCALHTRSELRTSIQ